MYFFIGSEFSDLVPQVKLRLNLAKAQIHGLTLSTGMVTGFSAQLSG
jgi:hypothetical protein